MFLASSSSSSSTFCSSTRSGDLTGSGLVGLVGVEIRWESLALATGVREECGMTKGSSLSVHYTAPHSPYIGGDGQADSMHLKDNLALCDNASFILCPKELKNRYAQHFSGLTNQCLGNRECLKGYNLKSEISLAP